MESTAEESAEGTHLQSERGEVRPSGQADSASPPPRLGFLGVGWIGRMRMEAAVRSGSATIAAVADPSGERLSEAEIFAGGAPLIAGESCLRELLDCRPDGVVIATPSALHADQALTVLEAGIPVFCQKPLGRNAAEAQSVIDRARRENILLGVDLSYRWTRGARRMRELVREGAIGHVYAANLVFHNAYGPDKAWFYDFHRSGGGCLMDLGVHLVDLALWTLDFPEVQEADGRLFSGGIPLADCASSRTVEDHAIARMDLAGGATVSLACSWKISAGCDAVIEATFHGTEGTLSFRNIEGSFYDFRTDHFRGRDTDVLDMPPDDWGGRSLIAWAERLRESSAYDPEVEKVARTSDVLDRVYRSAHAFQRRADG